MRGYRPPDPGAVRDTDLTTSTSDVVTARDRRPALEDRTISSTVGELWARVDGAGFVEALASGELDKSAHAKLLDYDIVAVQPGRLELSWTVPEVLLNPAGIAHGGFLVALLDDAAGLSAASRYPRFVPQLTLELRSDFVRPVVARVQHTVVGEVVRGGRTSNLCDARILSPDGELLARTTGTFVPNRRFVPRERWEEAGIA